MLSKFYHIISLPFSDFSSYQMHRHKYVPGTPTSLSNSDKEQITLHQEDYKIEEGLQALFPTLIGGGMKYLELKSDPAGTWAKSDKPLKVSNHLIKVAISALLIIPYLIKYDVNFFFLSSWLVF
jgi:hypothetical protein